MNSGHTFFVMQNAGYKCFGFLLMIFLACYYIALKTFAKIKNYTDFCVRTKQLCDWCNGGWECVSAVNDGRCSPWVKNIYYNHKK